mmetsp:Transcript_71087/g.144403  ORF Transcript_71087/g.144403 Transcript_71087/m.144403 type:complete len:133 (-) Transcript_71087:77-475(-)
MPCSVRAASIVSLLPLPGYTSTCPACSASDPVAAVAAVSLALRPPPASWIAEDGVEEQRQMPPITEPRSAVVVVAARQWDIAAAVFAGVADRVAARLPKAVVHRSFVSAVDGVGVEQDQRQKKVAEEEAWTN